MQIKKSSLSHWRQSESHHRWQTTDIFLNLFLNVTHLNLTIASFTCVKVCDLISTDLSSKYMSENSTTVSKKQFKEGSFTCSLLMRLFWNVPPTGNMQSIKLYLMFRGANLSNLIFQQDVDQGGSLDSDMTGLVLPLKQAPELLPWDAAQPELCWKFASTCWLVLLLGCQCRGLQSKPAAFPWGFDTQTKIHLQYVPPSLSE